jgi:acetolactate synthase small subunit
MRNDFIIEVLADNNFSVLNRMINVLNRRRVRIKKLVAHENEENFRKGGATMLLHTTPEMIEKVKQQLEKLIEVESANYYEADAVQRDALFNADSFTVKHLSKSY